MLVHQLPPVPSNLRVRTWRRLQELGAVAVKQSVYVLPDTPESREDFEWLKVEIEGAGGDAVVQATEVGRGGTETMGVSTGASGTAPGGLRRRSDPGRCRGGPRVRVVHEVLIS